MIQEEEKSTKELMPVEHLKTPPELAQRAESLLSRKFYKAIITACDITGNRYKQEIDAGQHSEYANATGYTYLTGSILYALRFIRFLPRRLLGRTQDLSEIQRPDADILLDVGIDAAPKLEKTLRAQLEPLCDTLDIKIKTGIYMPRVDIFINGQRYAEVLLIAESAKRITLLRERLGEKNLIDPDSNIRTHIGAQTINLEACAAMITVEGDSIRMRDLIGIPIAQEAKRDRNPATLYTKEKILQLAKSAQTLQEIHLIDEMYLHVRTSFYRDMLKLCELGQYIPRQHLPVLTRDGIPYLIYQDYVVADIFPVLSQRAHLIGADSDLQELSAESTHFREKVAKYIVRSILANPQHALTLAVALPYFGPFQPPWKKHYFMRALGWIHDPGRDEYAMHHYAPSMVREKSFAKGVMPNALEVAGDTLEQIQPINFAEILTVIIVFCGVYKREDIEEIVNSLAWPTGSSYLQIQEKWRRQQHIFDPKLNDEDKQKAIDLAFEIAQEIHPIPLLAKSPDNVYTQGEMPLLSASTEGLSLGEFFAKDESSGTLPQSERYLFVFLLTRQIRIQSFVQEKVAQMIVEAREA